jgi:hypothetical protein
MPPNDGTGPTRLRVAIDARLAASAPEIGWILASLLDVAGYARELHWHRPGVVAAGGEALDLYYGLEPAAVPARIRIAATGQAFPEAAATAPSSFARDGTTPIPGFPVAEAQAPTRDGGTLHYPSDVVLGAYGWLAGAWEGGWPRDRFDNLDPTGTPIDAAGLLGTPALSQLASDWRRHLEAAGRQASPVRWTAGGGRSALALSHDVDYPEAIRAIELLRHGRRGGAAVRALLGRENPFWRFSDWADLSEELGGASTFYFMARQGSLLRYALGDPDGFYDVRTPRYRRLLASLRERGCEIGLHASFRSSLEPARFAAEKARIEEASGGAIEGNRQHYWRLDPEAPHATLRQLEEAGFRYDSSLGLEMRPGVRRGLCHPFRPFDPERRRPLDLIELPPTWMDDHYDGRRDPARVPDAVAHARGLLEAVDASGGVALLDYHVRGMHPLFFPRYGPWLREVLAEHRPAGMHGARAADLARVWRAHADLLQGASSAEEAPAG